MLETLALPDTQLELMHGIQPEEALEWQAQRKRKYTGWHDLESTDELVAVARSITRKDDWLTVQTKGLHGQTPGRYAQAANTGKGYLVEVAQTDGETTHNWRIGLGSAADDAGNKPNKGPKRSQILSQAGAIEVLVSWLNGHGLPLGYGASLRIYQGT